MHVSWLAVSLKLEVMVFEISETVAHIFFPGLHLLRPASLCSRPSPNLSCNRLKRSANHKLRPQAAGTQLRARKIQIVSLLKLVIGELVPRGHPNAIRRAILANHVDSGQFRLFPTILFIGAHPTTPHPAPHHTAPSPLDPHPPHPHPPPPH